MRSVPRIHPGEGSATADGEAGLRCAGKRGLSRLHWELGSRGSPGSVRLRQGGLSFVPP